MPDIERRLKALHVTQGDGTMKTLAIMEEARDPSYRTVRHRRLDRQLVRLHQEREGISRAKFETYPLLWLKAVRYALNGWSEDDKGTP